MSDTFVYNNIELILSLIFLLKYIYIYRGIYIYIYNSKSLDVVQSLYFGSKLPLSGMYKLSKTNDTKFQPSDKKS